MSQLFWLGLIFIVLLMIMGFYCMLFTYNLLRVLIGLEILIKGVTLFVVLAGYLSGQTALAQSLAITIIVLEVVVMVVAAGLVLAFQLQYDSLNVKNVRNLRG
jgi:multisubunit Na+/H+ antiporter MnhC subunit